MIDGVVTLAGYEGATCETQVAQSACYKDPCSNGGMCKLQGALDRYSCACASGYRGKLNIIQGVLCTEIILFIGSTRSPRADCDRFLSRYLRLVAFFIWRVLATDCELMNGSSLFKI